MRTWRGKRGYRERRTNTVHFLNNHPPCHFDDRSVGWKHWGEEKSSGYSLSLLEDFSRRPTTPFPARSFEMTWSVLLGSPIA